MGCCSGALVVCRSGALAVCCLGELAVCSWGANVVRCSGALVACCSGPRPSLFDIAAAEHTQAAYRADTGSLPSNVHGYRNGMTCVWTARVSQGGSLEGILILFFHSSEVSVLRFEA